MSRQIALPVCLKVVNYDTSSLVEMNQRHVAEVLILKRYTLGFHMAPANNSTKLLIDLLRRYGLRGVNIMTSILTSLFNDAQINLWQRDFVPPKGLAL